MATHTIHFYNLIPAKISHWITFLYVFTKRRYTPVFKIHPPINGRIFLNLQDLILKLMIGSVIVSQFPVFQKQPIHFIKNNNSESRSLQFSSFPFMSDKFETLTKLFCHFFWWHIGHYDNSVTFTRFQKIGHKLILPVPVFLRFRWCCKFCKIFFCFG